MEPGSVVVTATAVRAQSRFKKKDYQHIGHRRPNNATAEQVLAATGRTWRSRYSSAGACAATHQAGGQLPRPKMLWTTSRRVRVPFSIGAGHPPHGPKLFYRLAQQAMARGVLETPCRSIVADWDADRSHVPTPQACWGHPPAGYQALRKFWSQSVNPGTHKSAANGHAQLQFKGSAAPVATRLLEWTTNGPSNSSSVPGSPPRPACYTAVGVSGVASSIRPQSGGEASFESQSVKLTGETSFQETANHRCRSSRGAPHR